SLLPAVVCHLAHNSMPLAILHLAGGSEAVDMVAGGTPAGALVPPEALVAAAAAVAVGSVCVALSTRVRFPEDSA
ncbi:MAG: hypothetical protein ACKOBP_05800, partial [Planctomycetia bacterium]